MWGCGALGSLQHLVHRKCSAPSGLCFISVIAAPMYNNKPSAWRFLKQGDIWFSDIFQRSTAQSNKGCSKVFAYHMLQLSVDHECNSQQLQLRRCRREGFGGGALYFETARMKRGCIATTRATSIFLFSFTHFTNFGFWMARQIGFGDELGILFFCCLTRCRTK